MSDREADTAAFFMTRLVVQLAIWILFGVVILIWQYPKFMLPLLAVATLVAIVAGSSGY